MLGGGARTRFSNDPKQTLSHASSYLAHSDSVHWLHFFHSISTLSFVSAMLSQLRRQSYIYRPDSTPCTMANVASEPEFQQAYKGEIHLQPQYRQTSLTPIQSSAPRLRIARSSRSTLSTRRRFKLLPRLLPRCADIINVAVQRTVPGWSIERNSVCTVGAARRIPSNW